MGGSAMMKNARIFFHKHVKRFEIIVRFQKKLSLLLGNSYQDLYGMFTTSICCFISGVRNFTVNICSLIINFYIFIVTRVGNFFHKQ